ACRVARLKRIAACAGDADLSRRAAPAAVLNTESPGARGRGGGAGRTHPAGAGARRRARATGVARGGGRGARRRARARVYREREPTKGRGKGDIVCTAAHERGSYKVRASARSRDPALTCDLVLTISSPSVRSGA